MQSYWIESVKNKNEYKELKEDIRTDVCIIGGGITGVSVAYKLVKENLNIILIEKDKMGYQTTGNSTAKITSQHGLFYKYLKDSKGEEFAKKYYEANENAIKDISNIIKEEKIDCDYEKQSAFIFAQSEEEDKKVKEEVEIVQSFGGRAKYIAKENIDKKVMNLNPISAIEFENQAQFNSYKYVSSLAEICKNYGVSIYENTKVVEVKNEENYYTVHTENGCSIRTKYLVVATKYPIINMPGFYFMKMYQSTSYAIAIETKEKLFEGMYISSANPKISLRTAKENDGYLLIVVGSDHKTGEDIDLTNSYKNLEDIAKKIYPVENIKYYWNTEDCITLDKIPYIGSYSKMWENAYVATGFNKWGITTSNIAAEIISDNILGKENEYEELYTSTRLEPIKNNTEMGNMLKETVNSLIIKKLKIPQEIEEKVKIGEGKIVEINGEKIGIYRNEKGILYRIIPKCKHLGCELIWNNLDKTWDCPCHGSRYDYKGKMIYGPTVKDLEKS